MFFLIYGGILLLYIVFVYSLAFSRKEKSYEPYNKRFSVIIPCYNEEPQYLQECIESILVADGDAQIIVVDNNSTRQETINALNNLIVIPNLVLLREEQQGKRHAHSAGLRVADGEIVVFVDSDTKIKKDTLVNLIKPFSDENVGAVCGNIKLANENKNFVTKALSAMYWNSFELYRSGITSFGYINVCSGALCAYRKELLLQLEEEYVNQTFLGNKCTISDDTFLTIRIQTRYNKKVEFVKDAVAYTYSPDTVKGYWKQIIRWRQGWLRESLLLWKEKKSKNKLLFADYQYNVILQLMTPILKIMLVTSLFYSLSGFSILGTVIGFLLFSSLYLSYYFVWNPKYVMRGFAYSLMYEFIYSFSIIPAMINIEKQGAWGTR